ncbi:Protein N-acetyltransferase, RimJ/RimL family [Treponema bryantii]|uniref:Protein N-acetyltransferase, RimJ/RimL family n=1 Tax=Treponema bryantii TaxID=163 RepID=A0A1I3NA15_9SPIR|nr:GNAT family protein [Treponema bryantii]SFJ06019.1 Protein N-acetyltransferase, RimJ/RimL family [Treponema bryantii]
MRIVLRPIKLEDGANIVKWRNTPSVRAHCINQNPITLESNEEFFHKNVETGIYQQFIVEHDADDLGVAYYPISTVYLKDIDHTNKTCELCIFTSDDEEWNSESQSIAVRMLLDKAFNELNMHKVYSFVFYKFLDEAGLLENAGFSKETILNKEAVNADGVYEDIVRFAITDEEWRKKK